MTASSFDESESLLSIENETFSFEDDAKSTVQLEGEVEALASVALPVLHSKHFELPNEAW